MKFFRDNINEMQAYIPGEQPANLGQIAKLNTNENPYPPSPRALEVLRGYTDGNLRLYPDAMARDLQLAVGDVLGVPSDWVLPGDGSDDLIIMIARSCLAPGRRVVFPTPTFPYYKTQGQIAAAEIVEIPTSEAEDFRIPIDAVIAAAGDVTFLSSPNSPTGVAIDPDRLDYAAEKLDGLLVIDEAYADFADANALKLLEKRNNVIILRTLSKGYSLAGLRVGFGIANPQLLEGVLKTKSIYNVGAIPAAVGAAALRDQTYHDECVRKIIEQRGRMSQELSARSCKVWASQGNFLMVTVPDGNAKSICDGLKDRDVLVRYFNNPAMADKLRISVGSKCEVDKLLAGWDSLELK
ncbi:MAG: histidinol-phosphate transaminase [Phycisphaerae bacterium]|nr:histidinol-phosphate transaminase [Phycisphaerae bacterium]